MRKVIVLGSINMDIVSRVGTHPSAGETVASGDFSYIPGGKGSNQAIAAHRLGAHVQLIGCVGGDAFGASLLEFYKEEAIDVTHITRLSDSATGAAFVAVDEQGENLIYVSPGANAQLAFAYADAVRIAKGDVVCATLETPMDTIEHMFKKARECGAVTVLNAAPAIEDARKLFIHTDYLVVNEIELGIFSGTAASSRETAIKSIYTLGALVPNVITTLGSAGVIARIGESDYEVGGEHVPVVDTTGAGDCFVGAFATALSEHMGAEESLRFANRAAALSVQKEGAALGMPSRAELSAQH